ncbi:MAG: diguanylate cyclase [Cyanobacteria bacterium P01_D01_bin.1]
MELADTQKGDSSAKAAVSLSNSSPSAKEVGLDGKELLSDETFLPGYSPDHYLQCLCQHPVLYSGDIGAAARIITKAATYILDIERVSLWQYSEFAAFTLLCRYDRKLDTYYKGTVLQPEDHTPYFKTLDSRPELLVEDISRPVPAVNHLVRAGLTYQCSGAFLELPIRRKGVVVGVLWCEHAEPRQWTALEKASALSISLSAAIAVDTQQHKALADTLHQQHRQLKRETIEREQAELAWQESQRFIQGIIDASTNILYIDSFADGSNFYVNRWIENVLGYEPSELQQLGSHYLEQLVHPEEQVLMVEERRKLAAINDGEVVENEYRFRHRQGHWRWLLCRETVFQRGGDGEPTQIFGTATDITKHKRAEVALKEFNQELKRLARMDGLTQVANRRSFDEFLEQAWKNIGSGRSTLSLILCDIDYFKSFNDTYGHQAGDICLRQVAEVIAQTVKRSTDLVARYGGEEFAVVLPNTSTAGAEYVADQIRLAVRLLNIEHNQSEVSDRITLSLGIASISSTDDAHPDMLIAAADQGLYSAKYGGRDRACTSEIDQGCKPVKYNQ